MTVGDIRSVHLTIVVIAALLVYKTSAAASQAPRRAQGLPSMGQPQVWEPYVVPSGFRFSDNSWHGGLAAGVHRPITHPVVGLFGITGEAYAVAKRGIEPGARILATSRLFGLAAGADWNVRSGNIGAIASFQTAIRRGGLLGRGTMLRIDWLPGRSDALNVGIHVPIAQPQAGRTRRRDIDVDAPAPHQLRLSTEAVPPGAEAALAKVAAAASMLLAYTNLDPKSSGNLNYGPSHAVVTRMYEQGLAEAFGAAANDRIIGDSLARRARTGLLDDVLIPYDSLFGQLKEEKRSIRPLTRRAHGHFLSWLRDSSRAGPAASPAIAAIHARWMGIIEVVHATLIAQWRDSRLVWLPLQLALAPDEYDEQSEVDALIERAVGHPFTDRNALAYLRSSDIPLEIVRTVFATRDYHVLWTHDFSGIPEGTRRIDEVSYAMVADAYLPALTQAVQRYDSTGHMPLYIIFHDGWFYELRNGRLWMNILVDPLRADMKLPKGNADKEAHLRKRQQELWAAVKASRRLQQDAIANGGDRFLHDVVKVHVNVMHPSDFSFRSHHIIPPLPFVPDNVMRDHRKIVIYDVAEDDAYRGAALILGVGIGENYASPTWEDRGYRLRGPAALEVRAAARRALRTNGFRDEDIPPPLAIVTREPKADSSQTTYVGRALQVHNETGFGRKESSVARAMLYNLAPPGSVIIVPDPLWLSDTWAAFLASAAARGCRVFIISPSKWNSPVAGFAVAAVQNDVMSRLIQSRDRMREQMRHTGGELRVGIYNARAEIDDVAGRTREVLEGLRRAPWIRELFPFDSRTVAVLDRAVDQAGATGGQTTMLTHDERPRSPKLHQKTQLVARPGAIAALLRQPVWEDILARSMRAQAEQTTKFADQLGWLTPTIDSAALRNTDALLRGYEQSISERDRKAVSFYFTLGSQNMDSRGLMSDGEATIIVSGLHAAAGVVDLYYLMARTTWIETQQELNLLVPRPNTFLARLARMIRYTL
jgi:phosphatidylserine/phosphatidylglycerophosphate/cardiolipin synthase-like enzyme